MTKLDDRAIHAANVLGLPAIRPLRNKGLATLLVLILSACGDATDTGSTTGGGRPGTGGAGGGGGETGGAGGNATGGATTGTGATGGATTGTGATGGATTGTGGATGGTGGATGGTGGATGGTGGATGGTGGGVDAGKGGSAGGTGGVDAGTGGASGAAGRGGTDGGAGTAGTGGTGGGSDAGGKEPPIPPPPATCPNIATGMISVMGQQVQIWAGPANMKGPMVFYWHGTGSNSAEAMGGLDTGVAEVQASGGVVASFTTSTATGMNTGNNVWYTGDFAMADIILACAVKQGLVDTRQIYTAGCSAGGLQVGAMVYGRSSYLAAAMPNSGGTTFPFTMQDSHVPAMCSTHGGAGDVVIISFPDATAKMNTDLRSKGGFVVNCDHGGGHCGSPAAVKGAQWKFLKAHPFGVSPEPYAAGLPTDFPTSCKIVP